MSELDIGMIRRLLCQRCNHGLGLFRDDPSLLRSAAYYVQFQTLKQQVLSAMAAAGVEPMGPTGRGSRR